MNKAQSDLCRKLNYAFVQPELLLRALTHRSRSSTNYERLEFLGDSVLNFVVSNELYERFASLSEGELTRFRASLVKKETLAAVARELALGDALALGSGELKSGGFDRDSILADSLEAIIGAVYLDGGATSVRAVVLRLLQQHLDRLDPEIIPKDPKTQLQEHLQKQSLPLPVYNVIQIAGDPHNQLFIVECHVPELKLTVRGEGATRRNAEQQAAHQALERLCKP